MLYNKVTLRRDCMALLPIRTVDLSRLLGVTRAELVDDYKHNPELNRRLYRLWMVLNILKYQHYTPAEMRKLVKMSSASVTITLSMEFNREPALTSIDFRPIP